MTAVIDSCLAVEYLLRTDLGDKAAGQLEAETLVAPELIDPEVLSVLRRAVLGGELAQQRAAQALQDLQAWDLERVSHRRLLHAAWSFRANVSGYDAFCVATAAAYDAPLLTADGPLSRAPRLGIVVQNFRA